MATLANRDKMTTATTGTGTITLGSAVDGFQTFASAGITNGDTVRYTIEDGDAWEIGTGTYTASGTTLSRSVTESSNSGAAISLSGDATVMLTIAAQDFSPTITLSGDVSGSATMTDLGDAAISVTISDDSHNHVIANVDGLQTALDNKASLSGATFTGDVDFGSNQITYSNVYSQLSDLPSASTYHGMFAHVHATGKGYFAHAGNWLALINADTAGDVSISGSIDFGNWTITETNGALYFATGGTNKLKLDANGNLDVVGNVNTNATIT